jgi:hypothetical protein
MNALAPQNSIAQNHPSTRGAGRLALCAGLALVITLLSARLIDHSVVRAYQAAVEPSSSVQLVVPLAPPSSNVMAAAARWISI